MPAYRKHLDRCLDTRRLTLAHLNNFGPGKKGRVIPRLFRGLFVRVFEDTGALRHQPDIRAIRLLRQLLGVVKKLRMDSSSKDRGKAVEDFYQVDLEVRHGDHSWSDHVAFSAEEFCGRSFTDCAQSHRRIEHEVDSSSPSLSDSTVLYGILEKVQQVADLCSSLLGSFDPGQWRPKHGPGAVSDERFGHYKYDFKRWPERLESVFPYADFAVANFAHVDTDSLDIHQLQDFLKENPARLISVPKTLSTPRLIASEPTSLQWCQQIIRDYMYRRVQETPLNSFIDFRRQELNGQLALSASHDSSHATIDLSSASDRISCWHVERLFRRLPCLLRALQATRSGTIEQSICWKSPKLYQLRKYSTMGNATTFPVQSVFFLVLSLAVYAYVRKQRVSYKMLQRMGKWQVRVFGDDIIVPKDCSGLLVELIETLGLRVNPNKTFTEGNFRESCGVDAFAGNDVTSVSVLDVPRRAGPGSIVSSVDVHHNLLSAGYAATAHFIQKTASRLVSNKIRFVKHGSGLFGWSDLCGSITTNTRVRWNRDLCRLEIYALRLKTREDREPPRDSAGLLQYFTEAPRVVTSPVSTLGYLSQRPRIRLNPGWVPAV
jgi:hypothetical protein